MYKLSVIIPVYKTPDNLLRGCIDSVLKQGSHDLAIELILVDDGCPLNGGKICDEYKQAFAKANDYNSIKVIHQENKGPSAARNAGLSVATGDYLAFADGDDLVEEGIYRKAVAVLSSSDTAKALVFGFDVVTKKGIIKYNVAEEKKTIPWKKAFDTIAADNFKCGGGYPWNKVFDLYSLKLLHGGKGPKFDEDLFAYEDKLWCLEALYEIGDVILLPEIGYRYKNDGNSTSNGREAVSRRQPNVYSAFKKMESFISKNRPEALKGLLVHWFKIAFTDYVRTKGNTLSKDQLREILPKLTASDFTRKKDIMAYKLMRSLIK